MSLSKEQYAYFENLFQSKKLALDKSFQRKQNGLYVVDSNIKHQWFQKLVEDYAKETIETRASSFIETCRKFSIFPDSNDLQYFIEVSKPFVMNKVKLLKEFCDNPFGPDLSRGVVDSILKTFEFDLNGIFRQALYPVEQLFLEGKVFEKEKQMSNSNAEEDKENLISKILTPLQIKWLEVIYDRQKHGNTITTREIMVELENELPDDFYHHRIGGAFLRDNRVTILGITLLDPEARIVHICNKMIESIWTLLRRTPKSTQLKSRDISDVSGIDLESTEWALMRIGEFKGIFHDSGEQIESDGWSVIDINERAFDDYRKFKSLEAVLRNFARNSVRHKVSETTQRKSQEVINYEFIKEEKATQSLPNNDSKDQILIGEVYKIVGEAGQLFRQINERDKGIDGEIELVNNDGEAIGERVYLQLKSGDSYLRFRKNDKKEIFQIKKMRWVKYWHSHKYPVMLVIRTSDGRIRWMNVTEYIKQHGMDIKKIEFQGEPFTADTVRQIRDSFL